MLLPLFQSISRRLNRRLSFAAPALVLLMLGYAMPSRAQLVVKNNYVEADVPQDGSGIVTVFVSNTNHQGALTHAGSSFLTVMVNNDSFYTNNIHLAQRYAGNFPTKTPNGYLQGGRTFMHGPDTIRTIWQPQGAGAYDIVQDVYPVEFPIAGSGQIVFRFSITNHQSGFLTVAAQYLLDVDISTTEFPGYANDNAPITTRYGYMEQNWQDFGLGSIPPYFIASLFPIDSPYFPGPSRGIAVGYCNDSLAPEPMGLMAPSLFAYVQWPEIVQNWTWGFPTSPNSPVVNDEGILLQWPAGGADSGQTNAIASFSYGSGACLSNLCFTPGHLVEMMVHPDHAVWEPGTPSYYSFTHFPVEGIVWNTSSANTALSATGTQTITPTPPAVNKGPVQIASPAPILNGGYQQTHAMTPTPIFAQHSSWISWEDTILQNPGLINCSTDSSYDISFSVSAGGIGSTMCENGTYSCPIHVDCQQKDVTAPRFTAWKPIGNKNHCGNFTTEIDSVYDNLISDQGVSTITWTITENGVPTPNAAKVTVPVFPPCNHSDTIPVTVTQLDSLHGVCVTFQYADCATPANISTNSICFQPCLPPVIFDTSSPKIRLLRVYDWNNPAGDSSCASRCSDWVVTDSINFVPTGGLQRDGGLDSIVVDSSTNMTFTLKHPVTLGMKSDTFTVCVNDTMQNGHITISSLDSAKNPKTTITINYCTDLDNTPPIIRGLGLFNPGTHTWPIQVRDTQAWDRGIDSVLLSDTKDIRPIPNSTIVIDSVDSSTWTIHPSTSCPGGIDFKIEIEDSFKSACFTIRAWDCAGNKDSSQTSCNTPLRDVFCPSDTLKAIGKDSITVIFSDNHTGIDYDAGIDSIWFTNIRNVTILHNGVPLNPPYVIKETSIGNFPRLYPLEDSVTIYVTDAIDSLFDSVCWNAIDGSGDLSTESLCSNQTCWTVPLLKDTVPPMIVVAPIDCELLSATASDNRDPLDRGIDSIWLDPNQTSNFKAAASRDSAAPSYTLTLPTADTTISARTVLTVTDEYDRIYNHPLGHTTSVDLSIYKQDLAMTSSGIVSEKVTSFPHQFRIPVSITKTVGVNGQADTFSLTSKGIKAYQFQFHITGSPKLTFVGTAAGPAMPAGVWTIAPAPGTAPGASPYVISGTGPALTDNDATDTLLYLVFSAAATSDIEEAKIVIDPDQCGEDVVFNGGNETITTTANSNITLPSPTGRLNSATIIIMDSCSTIVGQNNFKPTYLSILPVIPNPSSGSSNSSIVSVQYTVPDYSDANGISGVPVSMELYNALGQKERSIVSQVQPQGDYQATFDRTGLATGIYFLRLEAHGEIRTQEFIISR